MNPVVVDASVAFKWFHRSGEDAVDEAWTLLERHRRGDIALIAPPIMPFEVLNALHHSGVSDLGLRKAAQALSESGIEYAEPDADLLAQTTRFVTERGMTAYDASYAALAVRRDCELVSADHKAFDGLDGVRVQVM